MKKIRYTLLYLFISSFLLSYGQNVERTFRPGFFSTPTVIVPYQDCKILIGGKGRNDFLSKPSALLVMLDTMGNILWEHDFKQEYPSAEQLTIEDIFIEGDEIFVTVGNSCCCEVTLAGNLFKMNDLGQILEQFPQSLRHDELFKYNDKYIYRYSFYVGILDSGFNYIYNQSFYSLNNDDLKLTDFDYVESKILLTSINNVDLCGLEVLSIEEFPDDIYYFYSECIDYNNVQNIDHNEDGEIFIQNDNRIVVLDSNLNEVGEKILSDSIEIIKFKISEDMLLVLMDSLSTFSIKIYDFDLNLLHDLKLEEYLKLIPKDAFVKGDKLYLVGEERSKHQVVGGSIHIDDDSRSSIFLEVMI